MINFADKKWGRGGENQYSCFPWSREGGPDGTVRVGRVEFMAVFTNYGVGHGW